MKKALLIVILLSVFNVYSQQKKLTLNDAVLSYFKGLTPTNLNGLKWIEKSNNYIYKSGNKYLIKDSKGKLQLTISIVDFQKISPKIKKLPSYLKIDNRKIVFQFQEELIQYDYINKKEISRFSFQKNAQNRDYNLDANAIAYTIENNLYIANSTNNKIEITAHTDKNIVSGQAIHRSEFGIRKGTFWSPNGQSIAFYEKDESNVTDYPLVDITTYPATVNNIKYPMAGQKSEQAKIGVFNLSTKKTNYLTINTTDEHYLANLSWTPDGEHILLAEINRGQNHMRYNLYNVVTGKKVKTLFEEKNDRWVEPEHDAIFLPKSKTDFIWMSERDGFMNLYLYNTSGKLIRQLTDFKFVVKSILGFDENGKFVFVETTGKDGRNTHTFKINLSNRKAINITPESGVHHTQLSTDGSYLIDNYSSLKIPRKIEVVATKNGKRTSVLTAKNPLKDYKIGSTEFITLQSKDGFDLFGRIIKPANFDSTKRYPVLVYVYGGTHAQLVTNNWLGGASMWMTSFATEQEYIVFTIDNRGSANRGFDFESIIHRKAGEAAMEDQIIGIDYLKSLPYINSERIAVHGWSYGGFMTTSLMLRHPSLFNVAAAGGPVIDWKYYEIMYGERYMDMPQENVEGYEKSRVDQYISNLDGKLLIIHGSVDPVVVPQHSMVLLKEAVEKEVQVDFFTYPMHPHNVRGKDRVHLMKKILDYIVEHNHK